MGSPHDDILYYGQEENRKLRAALNAIAVREPTIDTMPLDKAFATLREVTAIARRALG